ncbi:hypothetical protein [Kutzneria sp. NPDC051319]|uniref:hypothetical protein n=1 Tax=Kutzneria sp. NPDC051319 TaxID=3155047 RepID=UPI00342E7B8E
MAAKRKRASDVVVPVESLAAAVFEYSPDRRRLRVRLLPLEGVGVVVDLSRSAVLDLAEKLEARAAGMAEPAVPAQEQRALPVMIGENEARR